MAANSRRRQDREARERLRVYEARQEVHRIQRTRRLRDNVIAALGTAGVVTLAALTQVFYFTAGPGAPTPAPTPSPQATGIVGAPPAELSEFRTWTGELVIGDVALGIELDGEAAPQAVAAWVEDVALGYYEGKICHRVAGDFSFVQCGSLNGDGLGDPGFRYGPVENAPADDRYLAGWIAMARSGNDAYSFGHQFFIVLSDVTLPSDAAGGYTVVGRVTSGLDELAALVEAAGIDPGAVMADGSGRPASEIAITAVTLE